MLLLNIQPVLLEKILTHINLFDLLQLTETDNDLNEFIQNNYNIQKIINISIDAILNKITFNESSEIKFDKNVETVLFYISLDEDNNGKHKIDLSQFSSNISHLTYNGKIAYFQIDGIPRICLKYKERVGNRLDSYYTNFIRNPVYDLLRIIKWKLYNNVGKPWLSISPVGCQIINTSVFDHNGFKDIDYCHSIDALITGREMSCKDKKILMYKIFQTRINN